MTGTSGIATRLNNLLAYRRKYGNSQAARFTAIKVRSAVAKSRLGWKLVYELNPLVRTGTLDDYTRCAERVWTGLRALSGLEMREFRFDLDDYYRYVRRADYDQYGDYYRGGLTGDESRRADKLLQHYISIRLLEMDEGDVYIDVASNTSPMKSIVRELFGATSYSLDLIYEPGVHGDTIGCDAGDTGLPPAFASKLSLHCSFEHFAYGGDWRFLREASGILRPGGRICIIPLYIIDQYSIRQDPTFETDLKVRDREGATIVYVKGYKVHYARFYDVRSFQERILGNCNGLKPTMYRIVNLDDIRVGRCYTHFALVLEKPLA